MKPEMIAIDWGSTSARVYLLGERGNPLSMRSEPLGIRNVAKNGFDKALEQLCGAWLDTYPDVPLFASGMIGSRNGWLDVPYAPCPAGVTALARGIATVETASGRSLHIVPGVKSTVHGLSDVMRGEETQIVGALPSDPAGDRLFLLPGTHSKWVLTKNGEIVWFMTFVTGELFEVLRAHTLLCKSMNPDREDNGDTQSKGVFFEGVEFGLEAKVNGGSVMSSLFSVRTRGLIDNYSENQQQQFLSGILIGAEIADARGVLEKRGAALGHVTLIGDVGLCERYRDGLRRIGFACDIHEAPAAATGLWAIANAMSSVGGSIHA